MTDKQPEALIRADELEAIGAESSLARAMAAHTIRLLYKENEALRARLDGWERVNMNDHKEGNLGIGNPNQVTLDTSGGTTFSSTPIDWDASAPLVVTPHPAFKKPWVGLTDEEIKEIVGPWGSLPIDGYTRKLFDQIETKLKEKNNG